jgi:hypothetical protein
LKRVGFEDEAPELPEVDRSASEEVIEWAEDWAPQLNWANDLEVSKKFKEN